MEVAKSFGADEIVILGDAPLDPAFFRKGGVDRALVTAPPSSIGGATRVLNYGGILAFIGIDYGGRSSITLDANDFHFRKLQLRASHAAPALYFPTVLQMLSDGQIDGPALISHRFPLERIGDAMLTARDCRDEALKIVVYPNAAASQGPEIAPVHKRTQRQP